MGYGSFTSQDWTSYKSTKGYTDTSTVFEMYTSKTIKKEFEPLGVDVRKSCDSEEHPNSTPIILALDVTGSMGCVLETISKKLNVLIEEIYDRNPVTDPQVMIMAFGDVTCDNHPLQVTQFESDIRIAEQLNDVYFERGGGGNDGESYTLPWYFASRHTEIDSLKNRNKKGILFTLGDEKYLPVLHREAIKEFIGDDIQDDLTGEEILTEVSRKYEVYHLLIEEGSGMRYGSAEQVKNQWIDLLGQRAVSVSDCTKIPEIMVSILEVIGGKEAEDVIDSWDGDTSVAVKTAISGLSDIKDDDLIEF